MTKQKSKIVIGSDRWIEIMQSTDEPSPEIQDMLQQRIENEKQQSLALDKRRGACRFARPSQKEPAMFLKFLR